ncbi:SULT1A4 [Branchiostoma lanceolatum]|uniref:Sulfotransferase n=2 Tax=Branchiostoma lanceolatum TaxID=7740 RepID=A0A8J9VUP9_BRALA|nr:SULT1A4 [Branchiostoma lanceolatum]
MPVLHRYHSVVPLQPSDYKEYQGVMFSALYPPEDIRALQGFQVRDDDVFIASYPRSGSTWMEEIVSLIFNGGDVSRVATVPVYERVPCLEERPVGTRVPNRRLLDAAPGPRVMKTRLPWSMVPPQVRQGKGKVVYLARNPKDTCNSLYHFHRMSRCHVTPESWAEFFFHFVEGKVEFGSWFDHILGWQTHASTYPTKMLFVKYEDLHKDPHMVVARVAQFLGRPLSPQTVDTVVKHCRFDNMKANPMTNYSNDDRFDFNQSEFLRTGTVANWKKFFLVINSLDFDRIYAERMQASGLQFDYDRTGEFGADRDLEDYCFR